MTRPSSRTTGTPSGKSTGPGALTHYGYQLPEQFSPEVGQHLDSLAGALQQDTTEAPHTMPIPQADGTVKTFQWDPKGRTWAEAPGLPTAAAKAAPLQHVETAAGIQTFDPGKGTLGPVIAQGKPSASLIVNPGKEADTTSNAESIVNGTLLPSMLSKRSADFNHLIAVANKVSIEKSGKPMNFTKLQLDYEASKRFVGSLNGNQMIRFKGLAGSVVNTIDEVKNLAEELKQGGVQRWNQAKRDTILQVYGNTPQSALAARYVSAVNTLKEEFANLAQGGYAPTEEAWRLANQPDQRELRAQGLQRQPYRSAAAHQLPSRGLRRAWAIASWGRRADIRRGGADSGCDWQDV